jgi:Holliday junction DNA helicase RuvA
MITSVRGKLAGVEDGRAIIETALGVSLEVLIPVFLAESLEARRGEEVQLVTFCYFEGQGQGSSFRPRLLGFMNGQQRDFFELFTTVSGIGYRKALRAMAMEPAAIAGFIHMRDSKSLKKLPEIGQKLAELIITELHSKVLPFMDGSVPMVTVRGAGIAGVAPATRLSPVAEDAVGALCALGESRGDAERMVQRALERGGGAQSADELVALVFATRR